MVCLKKINKYALSGLAELDGASERRNSSRNLRRARKVYLLNILKFIDGFKYFRINYCFKTCSSQIMLPILNSSKTDPVYNHRFSRSSAGILFSRIDRLKHGA